MPEISPNLEFDDIFSDCIKNLADNDLKEHDFVEISGTIINICDENCCFELACQKCKFDLNSNYYFENFSEITYDGTIR